MSDKVKLIIEIPKDIYERCKEYKLWSYDAETLEGAVATSKPLFENKGEWILDETDNSVECNKCLCQIYPNDISYGEPHFCPNCGADMRGKAE
jgi:hypothetical protein